MTFQIAGLSGPAIFLASPTFHHVSISCLSSMCHIIYIGQSHKAKMMCPARRTMRWLCYHYILCTVPLLYAGSEKIGEHFRKKNIGTIYCIRASPQISRQKRPVSSQRSEERQCTEKTEDRHNRKETSIMTSSTSSTASA